MKSQSASLMLFYKYFYFKISPKYGVKLVLSSFVCCSILNHLTLTKRESHWLIKIHQIGQMALVKVTQSDNINIHFEPLFVIIGVAINEF